MYSTVAETLRPGSWVLYSKETIDIPEATANLHLWSKDTFVVAYFIIFKQEYSSAHVHSSTGL